VKSGNNPEEDLSPIKYHSFRREDMTKVKVPRKIYEDLTVINREIHYTLDYSQVIKKAEDNGFHTTAEWLRNNEDLYKRGFGRGFEPE